ncbi:helix-turn-helix transcriptional regulator [Streptomyces sp. AK02-01A]|uniref:helix-turn-helix transcriptional regulator n=1 Tax=Streptomyces sp. AK02-01A TaxID=3028648 RepID=UPI0029B156E9|nr:helix-turn-helix transcriptional regulator [Streptomyces sp. AK02-01A]MDX3854489.1 helix-turn-helix transcriptional regulator [Streptomyces sp. AK02-01A]
MTRHGELGTALQRWRDRIAPAEAGLLAGEPGREPGLRHAELAQLTGLSVDYIIRLEQGRATSPSVQVLTSLARALRLSDDERRHLFLLAGQSPPALDRVSDHIPASVRRLLDQLAAVPLGVHDAAWNLITWNPLWAALVGDPTTVSERGRNAAWQHFTALPSRITHTPEQEARFEAAIVSDLRSAAVRYPTDVRLRFLVGQLRRASSRFAGLWNSRIVGFHDTDTRTVHHPDVGPVAVDCDTLIVPGCDLRIAAYSAAPGTEAADKLRLLAVIGVEAMPAPATPDAGSGPATAPADR